MVKSSNIPALLSELILQSPRGILMQLLSCIRSLLVSIKGDLPPSLEELRSVNLSYLSRTNDNLKDLVNISKSPPLSTVEGRREPGYWVTGFTAEVLCTSETVYTLPVAASLWRNQSNRVAT